MKNFASMVLVSSLLASMSFVASANTADEFEGIYQPIGQLVSTTITAASYQPEGHLLLLNIEYQACEALVHTLTIGDVCSFSDPMRCGAALKSSEINTDPRCAETISEVFTYKLSPSQDNFYLTIRTDNRESATVFIGK